MPLMLREESLFSRSDFHRLDAVSLAGHAYLPAVAVNVAYFLRANIEVISNYDDLVALGIFGFNQSKRVFHPVNAFCAQKNLLVLFDVHGVQRKFLNYFDFGISF